MLITILTLFFVLFLFIKYYQGNRRLPPGPFRFPIIGSIPQIAMRDINFPHKAFAQLSEKYGDLMSVGMGVHYMVVVSSYEYIKEIFTMNDVTSRYPLPFAQDRNFGKNDLGIVFADSLDIKHYTIKKMKELGYRAKTFLDPLFEQEASELIKSIRKGINPKDGTWEVNPWLLSVSTLNISWAFMAGSRLSLDNPLLLEAVKGNEQQLHAIGLKNKYTAFPFLKNWFPHWSGHVEHMEAFNHLHKILREMVKGFKNIHENSQSDSLINSFLKEIENADESNKHLFNEEQLIVTLSDVFLAASETASNCLNWMLLYICLHPEVQEKIYKEIEGTIGKDGILTLEHEKMMPYTKSVMFETMRMSHFIPLSVPRIASRDIEIGGYCIPKGSGITYNLAVGFTDPKIWGDPESFRPERFIEYDLYGVPQRLIKTERILHFGVGKRICPGESLGITNVWFIIASLVQEFKFSVIPGKIPSSDPVCRISIRPENYSLKLDSRKK